MPLFDVPSAQPQIIAEIAARRPPSECSGASSTPGLIGVPMLGPWFMGGRHPLGELVIVVLAVVVALAWLGTAGIGPQARARTRSPGEWILLAAVAVVAVQLVPWPQAALDFLSPHTRQLLTLWQGDLNVPGNLGHWSQVSMTPDWTRGRPDSAAGLRHDFSGGRAAAARCRRRAMDAALGGGRRDRASRLRHRAVSDRQRQVRLDLPASVP